MAWVAYRTWVTGETVTAALLNQDIRDNGALEHPDGVTPLDWTPTLEAVTSNPLASEITETGEEFALGGLQFCWATWTMTASFTAPDAGSGIFFVTLPATASGVRVIANIGGGQAIGSWSSRDDSAATTSTVGVTALRSTTEAHFLEGGGGLVTEVSPYAWNALDALSFWAVFPTA